MDQEPISENQAWKIVSEFARDLRDLDPTALLAVYAIGSMGGGYYRPGQSDIDTVVIVLSEAVISQEKVDQIAARYCQKYHVPKGFGTVVMTGQDLYPPYHKSEEYDFEFSLEIARLKLQGKVVYGTYDLEQVPLPARDDLIHDARIMEAWFDREFGAAMFDRLEDEACVNSILLYLRRYLMIEKNIFIFNKLKTVEAYCAHEPPIVDPQVFALIKAILNGHLVIGMELEILRHFGNQLRRYMNHSLLNR